MDEAKRLSKQSIDDIPDNGLILTISLDRLDGEKLLSEVREILFTLIKIENLAAQGDDVWEENLPKWFVEKTKSLSYDELLKNDQLWDFGSWIDAIKRREWKWWGYKLSPSELIIFLETLSIPYHIDPFFYILYSCGVDIRMTRIVETFPGSDKLKVNRC